jgi:hypothetical protein
MSREKSLNFRSEYSYWSIKAISNKNFIHNKVVALEKSYNFRINFISIRVYTKDIWFLKICCQEKKSLCRLFERQNEVQSCRSQQNLQFSYKIYLHSSQTKKLRFFKIGLTPTAARNYDMDCYSTRTTRAWVL